MKHLTYLALLTSLVAAAAEGPASRPAVFDLPRVQAQYAAMQSQLATLFRAGRYADAERLCRDAARVIPFDPAIQYNLTCALAKQGKVDEAVQAFGAAVSLGYRDVAHARDDADLAALRDRDDFKKLLEKAATARPDPSAQWKFTVTPAPIEDGVALVREANTAYDQRLGVFRSFFRFEPGPTTRPVAKGMGPAGDLLRKWFAEGSAAGNHGDLYDNHDTDHSNMNYGAFPQIARIEFDQTVKARRLHHGIQLSFLFNGPTIGNSSTALTSGAFWRSQPRHALTQPRGPQMLCVQYLSNHIYFYPEHRDHDPGHNGADGKGHGDVIPANTPYMIISQGSSGSDVAFMNAVAATLAAFRPEVKKELVRTGTLMPAVQMIFRSSNKMVKQPDDYFTGKAHPTVFDSKDLDVTRMVTMAHDLTADALPPMVRIRVVEEDRGVLGVDYFDVAEREKLFDTPFAIARVVRSTKYTRRMVLSAEDSRDIGGKPLTWRWAVLRGDAERIQIKKMNPAGSVVEVLVSYHERRPVAEGSDLESNRVDIGAFVSNGAHWSAPAFVSLNYLDNEKRVYSPEHRIVTLDYTDPEAKKNYVDPMLDFRKDWRDDYAYDAAGHLTGWTRTRGKETQRFTADGLLVTKTDTQGRPTEAQRVQYIPKQQPNQPGKLEQQTTGRVVKYEYSSAEDRVGKAVEEK